MLQVTEYTNKEPPGQSCVPQACCIRVSYLQDSLLDGCVDKLRDLNYNVLLDSVYSVGVVEVAM